MCIRDRDEAASKVRLKENTPTKDIKDVEEKINNIKKEKEESVRGQNFEKAAKLRDEQRKAQEMCIRDSFKPCQV